MKISAKKIILSLSVFFLFTLFFNAQNNDQKRIYIKTEIKGLACPYCAFGMEKQFKKVAGISNVEIELKEGLAYIDTPIDQKPTKKALRKIIIDAGFTPGEISFSVKPFVKKNN